MNNLNNLNDLNLEDLKVFPNEIIKYILKIYFQDRGYCLRCLKNFQKNTSNFILRNNKFCHLIHGSLENMKINDYLDFLKYYNIKTTSDGKNYIQNIDKYLCPEVIQYGFTIRKTRYIYIHSFNSDSYELINSSENPDIRIKVQNIRDLAKTLGKKGIKLYNIRKLMITFTKLDNINN